MEQSEGVPFTTNATFSAVCMTESVLLSVGSYRTALVALRRKHRHAAKITHRVRELPEYRARCSGIITHQDMHGFQREKQSENGSVQEARPKDVPSGTDCVSDAQMTVLSERASFRLGSTRSRTIAHTVGR